MTSAKLSVAKYVLACFAVLGLVGWNIHLQHDLHQERLAQIKGERAETEHREKRSVNAQNSGIPFGRGGAVYVRWGRTVCPNDESELVYSGVAGASYYQETGGGSEYICLTRDVQYESNTPTLDGTAKIQGVELEIGGTPGKIFNTKNANPSSLQDADVTCAVCRSKSRVSQVMIPGRKDCYPGWKKEYWGYLMTEHYAHKAWHTYACVDEAPEAEERGHRNDNGGLMYFVQGVCGSLPCPNYVQGMELTCVVCTR